jgi:2-polyprenyl-3-methyl-5-hydroxy-6-metoxy-1,4-benzoquinol methylase
MPSRTNIHYKSDSIAEFYSKNRVRWNQFYPSEQHIFEKVFAEHGNIKTVLDVGCACGGLGRALHERFAIGHYCGVDVSRGSIELARMDLPEFPVPCQFECADIAARPERLAGKKYDLVTSLGCADWNCDTDEIIRACWDYTAEGGYFVFSFRLTNQKTLDNMSAGYQYVHFEDASKLTGDEEKAPYVVTNVLEMTEMVDSFVPKPDRLLGYGYWGTPSVMAVIPYKSVVFSVLAVRKNHASSSTIAELLLPLDLLVTAKSPY